MLSKKKRKEAKETIMKWVETFIVGLNLCPFAKAPMQKGEIRYSVVDGEDMKEFLEAFAAEIDILEKDPKVETTLMIIPAFGNMTHFQAFMGFCEEMIIINHWIHKFQIVSFHPYMRFLGLPPDSPENLTGIAPYPILHILRVPSVETLGATVRQDVIAQNSEKLRKMSKVELAKLWKKVLE